MTLTVEDGTGLSNADAYISVADAETYFTNYSLTGAWDNFTPTDGSEPVQQEVAIRYATKCVDDLYGDYYASRKLTQTQSLLFPRFSWHDDNGTVMSGVPTCLAQATAEVALLILDGFDPLDNSDDTGRQKLSRVDLEGIRSQQEYFFPIQAKSLTMGRIATILAPILKAGTNGIYAQVMRG